MSKAFLDDARAKFKESSHRIESLFNSYAKSKGLNFTSLLILELLYDENETYTQKDLCEKLALPKQLVNTIIKSFWEQEYVELKEAKDRRNKNIILTDKGKSYTQGILHCMQDAEDRAWECFTDDEVISFVNSLEKYAKSFERILRDHVNIR
ncbi:MAG: winged helix-turn-helix transcriptional regulator [Defluviitaleaceae bacterium]|nr:winged helix-turn-helix transcriptional regulator [Defluviitaleaceae bacterium]